MKTTSLLMFMGILSVIAGIGTYRAAHELMSSWKIIFHVLDVNDDAVVNRQDAEDCRARYIALTNGRGELNMELLDKLDQWWEEYVFQIAPEMTIMTFLKEAVVFYRRSKTNFEDFYKTGASLIFQIHDTNADSYISWQEFNTSYAVFGLNSMASDYGAFLEFEPEDWGVPEYRFVEAWAGVTYASHHTWTGVLKDRMVLDGLD